MCNCKDVELGSYENTEIIPIPDFMITEKNQGVIQVDKCLVNEVKELWSKGIHTLASCCGHNKVEGFISVIDSDIPRMKAMGYEVKYNNCRPGDEDSFHPQSI